LTNSVFSNLPTTIFEVMSGLARRHQAVNLGQGFPDHNGPEDVRAAAADALLHGWNQYPPMAGIPELRAAVAAHYRHWQGLDIAADQVTVTAGATEALAAALFGLIEPGDEVVLFQPLYDAYAPLVRRAGGVPRFVSLAPPDWRLTEEGLARAITPKTKLVLFNNPHNPAAVVFDDDQLALLAEACVRHDLIAICDEVWEHVVFDGRRHRPLMSFPGMAERCVKIGSAGKVFSLTGWKVGWMLAPPRLVPAIAKAHQFLTFTVAPATQAAIAYGLSKPDESFETMRSEYQHGRDRLTANLRAAGFAPLPSAGTYFLNVDLQQSGIALGDAEFCLRAVEEAGVAAIPVSAFYVEDAPSHVIRLCFAKSDATLDEGVERLVRARAQIL
jgi:N-succinyldiaminopimelate aminotransferase